MLKCFFEIERDKALFDGLKIAQERALCENYTGKFPVISISLKSVDGFKYESAAIALRTIIGNVHTISDVRCDEYFGFTDADIFRLWIPNGEIRKLFYELVEDWFRQVTRSDTSRISRFCAAFPAGDTAVRRNRKENFYHGMLHGLLQNQDSWLVKSNAKTGEGYSDISIQTPDRGGIVIELKVSR